jgi:hypothetical protein
MAHLYSKKNTKKTSSPVHRPSNESWMSGLSQVSAIEAAILNAEDMPTEINRNKEFSTKELIIAGGERNMVLDDYETSKWMGPLPIDSYLLNDDPNPKLIVKKSKQTLNYVQEYGIR